MYNYGICGSELHQSLPIRNCFQQEAFCSNSGCLHTKSGKKRFNVLERCVHEVRVHFADVTADDAKVFDGTKQMSLRAFYVKLEQVYRGYPLRFHERIKRLRRHRHYFFSGNARLKRRGDTARGMYVKIYCPINIRESALVHRGIRVCGEILSENCADIRVGLY